MVTKSDLDALKLEAKIEREMGVIRYVYISIEKRGKTAEVLHRYDLPHEIYKKYHWVIRWRIAYWQCKYPREHISSCFYFYDKKSGLELGYNTLLSKYVSAKAQVTKVKNASQTSNSGTLWQQHY